MHFCAESGSAVGAPNAARNGSRASGADLASDEQAQVPDDVSMRLPSRSEATDTEDVSPKFWRQPEDAIL